MTWFEWVASEKNDTEKTDWCSGFFDVWFGYRLWKPCKIHDFFNRGYKIPGRDAPANLMELQFVFWKAGIRQVHRDVTLNPFLVIPHLFLGYLTLFVIWMVTNLTVPIWYRNNL